MSKDGSDKQVESRWKPGQSGNPAGRQKKEDCLTSLLKIEIEKICPEDKEGRTWKQLIVLGTMRLAIQGVPVALKEVWERIDGKVPNPVTVEQDQAFRILVEYVNPDAANDH